MSLTAAQTQNEASTAEAKLRILFVSRYLWGYDGITIHLKRLAKELQRRGHEVALASGTDEARRQKYDDLRWFDEHMTHYFVPFPERLSWRAIGQCTHALRALHRVIRTFEPSVIHSHSLSLIPYFSLLRGLHDPPLVSTCHIEFDQARPDIRMASLASRLYPSLLSDHIIAKSLTLANAFSEQLHFPSDKITQIYYGIDDNHFRPPTVSERRLARESFGLKAHDHVVCLVGRLDPVKGHRILFDAVHALKKAGLRVKAICAGTGEKFEGEIKALSGKLQLDDQNIFPGHADARQVYWASDIKVLPSYREGNPIVISEAMLCGLPAIRTPTSGAQDQTIEAETGYIVPFDAPDQLAERMRYLFDHPEKRAEMGRAAQTYAKQHFTLEATVDQTERLYRRMILSTQ